MACPFEDLESHIPPVPEASQMRPPCASTSARARRARAPIVLCVCHGRIGARERFEGALTEVVGESRTLVVDGDLDFCARERDVDRVPRGTVTNGVLEEMRSTRDMSVVLGLDDRRTV